MEKKDIGEVVYNSMLGDVFSEYTELLLSYYKPRLSVQYDEAFVRAKLTSLTEIGKTRAKIQKNRAKAAIMALNGGELLLYVNGCFEELKYQLLKQLRRSLGEAPEYALCEQYLTETTEEQKELVKALIMGEDSNDKGEK
ncbi:MAG: hypothetical protein PHN69_02415 [Candidatus Pacebacteria bacterium]|nr:hypothetical protein [Candidatus Paceibacterota bacterium]